MMNNSIHAFLILLLLAGCSQEFESPFFNYQDCVKKTAAENQRRGSPRIKAELDAKEYCRKLYAPNP